MGIDDVADTQRYAWFPLNFRPIGFKTWPITTTSITRSLSWLTRKQKASVNLVVEQVLWRVQSKKSCQHCIT